MKRINQEMIEKFEDLSPNTKEEILSTFRDDFIYFFRFYHWKDLPSFFREDLEKDKIGADFFHEWAGVMDEHTK
jgi:hypothetical protein